MRVLYHKSTISARRDYDAELVLYLGEGDRFKFSFIYDGLSNPVRGSVMLTPTGFMFDVEGNHKAKDFVFLYKILREVFTDGFPDT